MKTNIFKLSFMALAATVLMTGCSQDDEMAGEVEQGSILDVSATIKAYTPDAETRVTDELDGKGNYSTSFENGNSIGIYVIVGEETIIENKKLTYDDTDNKWTATEPLYYYKNAQYIAYSPYEENLTLSSGETIDKKIKDYFINTVWVNETKSYADRDLMIATYTTENDLPSGDNVKAAFEFKHVMSMVEFWIPAKTYNTKIENNVPVGYSYRSIPMSGLSFEMKAGDADWVTIEPFNIDGKRYRMLLDPDSEANQSMHFGGQFQDGDAPVYFRTAEAAVFNAASGTFKKVKVTRDGYSFEPTERAIQVGDYYYSDGNIVPSTESTIPEEIEGAQCIGIVFSTDMTGTDTGKENGYVIALRNHAKFDKLTDYITWWKNQNDTEVIPRWDGGDETFDAMLKANSGYSVTQKLINKGTIGNFETINYAYKSVVPFPEGSTGWYLPTLGEMITAFANLCNVSVGTSGSNLVPLTAEQFNGILDKMFANESTNRPNNNDSFGFWTATDKDDTHAWGFAFNAKSGTASMFAANWTKEKQGSRTMCFRPILAF